MFSANPKAGIDIFMNCIRVWLWVESVTPATSRQGCRTAFVDHFCDTGSKDVYHTERQQEE